MVARWVALVLFSTLAHSAPSLTQQVDRYFDHLKSKPIARMQFLKAMPKGGELHYHLFGGVYPEVMLKTAMKSPHCVDLKTQTVLPKQASCKGLKTTDLTPHDPRYQHLLKAWSLKNFDTLKASSSAHFFEIFYKSFHLYMKHRGHFLASVMRRAAAQHEHYLEVLLLPQHIPTAGAPLRLASLDKRYAQLMHDAVFQQQVTDALQELRHMQVRARQELGCAKHPDRPACQLKVVFQYHALREQPLEQVFAQVLQGFLMVHHSSEVVGVNLVQEEAGPIALRDYQHHMAIFNYLHQHYPEVPISLHAGELPMAVAAKHPFHVRDAVRIGHARRIGHGADILQEPDYPSLLRQMAKHSIAVEINLTSNQRVIQVAGPSHPLLTYLKYNVPIVLSSDDEGILRTSLTHEYDLAALRYNLPYHTLKQFSRNSLTYSFLPGRSLWENPQTAEVVPACQHLGAACQTFLAHSEKARLQWALEREFEKFEKRYSV